MNNAVAKSKQARIFLRVPKSNEQERTWRHTSNDQQLNSLTVTVRRHPRRHRECQIKQRISTAERKPAIYRRLVHSPPTLHMPLTIKPPRPPAPSDEADHRSTDHQPSSHEGSSSPVAPEYSPITPKVQPALPVIAPRQDGLPPEVPPIPEAPGEATMTEQPPVHVFPPARPDVSMSDVPAVSPATAPPPPSLPETEYIPEPPSLPFSSEDSPDGIALRAALSSLQFQKQKAQQDIQTLDQIKKQAMADPERFRQELVAGRLKEQRPDFGSIRDILDAAEEGDDDEEVVFGARDEARNSQVAEVPDPQPSSFSQPAESANSTPPFPPIPGPQDVVRMPPINWEKYHVVGEALDALHEQQRRWPGSTPGQERGREHALAAPYSPFYDKLDAPSTSGQHDTDPHRSHGSVGSAIHTPSVTGTVSEHPMSTRRSLSSKHQP